MWVYDIESSQKPGNCKGRGYMGKGAWEETRRIQVKWCGKQKKWEGISYHRGQMVFDIDEESVLREK